MASVLYVANTTAQSVLADGIINLGTAIHKNCQSQATLNGNVINIAGTGYFEVDVSATFTVPAAGDVTIQLYKDGVPVPGAISTQNVATADTQVRSVSFSTEILKSCCCKAFSSLTLVNTGVAADFTNVAIRVKRDA